MMRFLMLSVLLSIGSLVFTSHVLAQNPANSMFAFAIQLRGIGPGGNTTPLRPSRTLVADVFNSQNQLIVTRVGKVTYNSTTGLFEGTLSIGFLQAGSYTVKIKTSSYLQKTAPGIIQINQGGGVYTIQPVVLSAGDVTDDNKTNVLDYNVLMGCYSDLTPAKKCNSAVRELTDFNDDGKVNQFDYNLFLRELSTRSGA